MQHLQQPLALALGGCQELQPELCPTNGILLPAPRRARGSLRLSVCLLEGYGLPRAETGAANVNLSNFLV